MKKKKKFAPNFADHKSYNLPSLSHRNQNHASILKCTAWNRLYCVNTFVARKITEESFYWMRVAHVSKAKYIYVQFEIFIHFLIFTPICIKFIIRNLLFN